MQGKIRQYQQNKLETSPGRKSKRLFLLFVIFSLAVHFLAYVNVRYFADGQEPAQGTDKVKIRYVEKKTENDKQLANKQVIETPMPKTEKPEDPKFLGAQDHATKEQTKIKDPNTTAMKVGPKGQAEESGRPKLPVAQDSTVTPKDKGRKQAPRKKRLDALKSLLPTKEELLGQMNAGYQDFIEDDIKEGNVVSLNTANFRFLGYVTHLRQAIQLVWTYPQEAALRGLEGKVLLQFRIRKDGSTDLIKVVQSSGHSLLDQSIVSAIRLASPFAPLPEGVEEDAKIFAGTFHYTLSSNFRSH